MTRETALQILAKHLSNPVLLKHSFAVEAAMRSLASNFRGDVDTWGITGLLHDADYEESKGHPEKHGKILFEEEPNSIPSVVEHAIRAHNNLETHVLPESPLDWSLYCCDDLTGFITAIALTIKSKKLSDVTAEMVLEKLVKKDFIKEMKRSSMYLCEEKLGIPLREFVAIVLTAMQAVHEELAL